MRRGIGCATLAVVACLGSASAAGASITASATTTTGQTLTIAIDSPADGATITGPYGTATVLAGHVALSAPKPGANRPATRIDHIAMSRDGVDEGSSTSLQPDGSWARGISDFGPRVYGMTVIAADGTRATALIHLTFPRRQPLLGAYPAAVDGNTTPPSVGGQRLRAQLAWGGGAALEYLSGESIGFLVNGSEVCRAITDDRGIATCDDPSAARAAIVAGGYDVRYDGSAYYEPATAHGDLLPGL